MGKRTKKINYAEVESDVDMSEADCGIVASKAGTKEDRDKKGKGDTYGTIGKKKKRAKTRRDVDQPGEDALADEPAEPMHDAKLLLQLPFDLLAEVCKHLAGKDLLGLAQVNQSIRKTLLSRSSRSIWSSRRRSLGFPLPDGLTELDFALLEYSLCCQTCTRIAVNRDCHAFLRIRTCHNCRRTSEISSKGITKVWPGLHPMATKCVRYIDQGSTESNKPRPRIYLVSDLERVDQELKELEEEDDLAVSLKQAKGSSTRTRRSTANIDHVDFDRVEEYVKEKQAWVESEQKVSKQARPQPLQRSFHSSPRSMPFIKMSQAIKKIREELVRIEREANEARWSAAAQALRAVTESLKKNHGWTKEEADFYAVRARAEGLGRTGRAEASLEDDPEVWMERHLRIKQELAERKAHDAAADSRNGRQDRLRPFYKTLKGQRKVFPDFYTFLRLESVQPLWQPEDAVMSNEKWAEQLPKVTGDLDAYQEARRVDIIRQILAANKGLKSASSLSTAPADYPDNVYDAKFFSRLTSLLVRIDSAVGSITVAPYPHILADGEHRRIGLLQVHAMRAIAGAANLEPDASFMPDLDNREAAFVWTNDPRKTGRHRKLSWFELLHEILRHGPSNAKVAEGHRVEVDYRPDFDVADDDSDLGRWSGYESSPEGSDDDDDDDAVDDAEDDDSEENDEEDDMS
ncbi:hypothetical protein JCM11491_004934 [Sporobolomyces phaffii]